MNVEIIRKQLLNRRRSFSADSLRELSHQICTRFLTLSGGFHTLRKAKLSVGLYRALPDELSLSLLDEKLRELDFRLFYPRICDSKSHTFEFIEVSTHLNGSNYWKKGNYGIEEPVCSFAEAAKSLDVIFLPGVGFGEQGERIGMGAGFYDRILPHFPMALRVALAFDFQVLPSLPQSETDQRVHWIVSETKDIRSPFVSEWNSQKSKI